ncbi:MAG: phosphoribosylformylglycinamidine synthase subunit PurQ [Bacteroidales bacterium]|jgi:phosphoribosylformylglycinamidine synthase|nr:phosphoribosylformylglycinamidine synthase subunit PurQ [Bacteroidales bacterium]
MKVGVVIFPGSNCDHDMIYIWQEILKQEVVSLWHKDTDLKDCQLIILPGGFSYGDYLRSGAIARFSPIMENVINFANKGGYLFGVCNGFQVLTESKLLEGALLANNNQKFICKNQLISVQTNNTIFTKDATIHKPINVPIAHGEGRFYADENTIESLKKNDQILFRYCNEKGEATKESNPNGSIENIAGICNKNRNVFGMMPHPERSSDKELYSTDGIILFQSLINNIK